MGPEGVKVEIFIVSFSRDIDFLRYNLLSIHKFATGFAGVTVAVPDREVELFSFAVELGAKLVVFYEPPKQAMMAHELQIINADKWCPNADVILFSDSDCMFWAPVTPADYFVDGKPVLYRERFDTLTNKLRLNWRTAVVNATGICPFWETMVRHPALHIPATHVKTRQLIEHHTGQSVDRYILGCEGNFPQTFCEFNSLGSVAIEFFPDKYHFVEYDVRTKDGGYDYSRPRDFLKAFWSHAGVDPYRREMDAILR